MRHLVSPWYVCAFGSVFKHLARVFLSGYQVTWPMKHGQVENWTHMESFWEHCIFRFFFFFLCLLTIMDC